MQGELLHPHTTQETMYLGPSNVASTGACRLWSTYQRYITKQETHGPLHLGKGEGKGKKGGRGKGPKEGKCGTSWYVITSTITITIHDP